MIESDQGACVGKAVREQSWGSGERCGEGLRWGGKPSGGCGMGVMEIAPCTGAGGMLSSSGIYCSWKQHPASPSSCHQCCAHFADQHTGAFESFTPLLPNPTQHQSWLDLASQKRREQMMGTKVDGKRAKAF